MQLRSYLEGKANLTLPTLRRILRSHYQERGATELYKQLMSEVQDSKETPQNFLIRVLDLRQKILFATQEAESSLKYDPILVQNMFLHTVLTGLQNDYIRGDLKPYLQQTDVSDELLLEKLNLACMTETERQNKKKIAVQHRSVVVHSVECNDISAPAEKKGKTSLQENKNKHNPDLLNELREIKSDMALLKNLSAEVSQIRESIQLPQTAAEQGLSSPVINEEDASTVSRVTLTIIAPTAIDVEAGCNDTCIRTEPSRYGHLGSVHEALYRQFTLTTEGGASSNATLFDNRRQKNSELVLGSSDHLTDSDL
ncbi:Chaperone protein ClpB [Labeo rohita]|uniref:Chaperone protein ClpB n=1 Tax=Labeo rohita TaxID=84645 RepID=A0ABQ8L9E3_LABRO|nr:Chaperone protein ClpB [Labeo rohita]